MPGTKELRLRIKSLKNTSKITAAMKMVSAAKLRKAQEAYARHQPYVAAMQGMLDRVLRAMKAPNHPLTRIRPGGAVRYVVVASDRGLCGSFNNGLFRTFLRRPADAAPVQALGIGRRARDMISRAPKMQAVTDFFPNAPQYVNAVDLGKFLINDFVSGKCDRVVLVYNRFQSVLSQEPVLVPLLPFVAPAPEKNLRDDYFAEPSTEEIFAELLPKWVIVRVYQSLLDNAVGEHSARMTAMDSATKNTRDLIDSLTLIMNRARQAAITRELIEIVSGAEALKG